MVVQEIEPLPDKAATDAIRSPVGHHFAASDRGALSGPGQPTVHPLAIPRLRRGEASELTVAPVL